VQRLRSVGSGRAVPLEMTVDPGFHLGGRGHVSRLEQAHDAGVGAKGGQDILEDELILRMRQGSVGLGEQIGNGSDAARRILIARRGRWNPAQAC